MIVSASRRTDIPAFHAEWFMERVRAGFADVPNPFNARQRLYVDLRPETVESVVFWTRNPAPLLPYLDELEGRGLRFVFLVTVMDAPKWLEPATPELEAALDTLQRLSGRIGRNRIAWRYDPVLLSPLTPAAFHVETFGRLAERLAPLVSRCIVSVFDPYPRPVKRLQRLDVEGFRLFAPREEKAALFELLPQMAASAEEVGLQVQSCCEGGYLEPWIKPGACVDPLFLERAFGRPLPVPKDKNQRLGCLCAASKDIGSYSTCSHGCLYCYANR